MLNSNERRNPISEVIQFNVVEQFKYLRVQILPRLENIVDANYEPLMVEINESTDRWMSLPVSIFGRINILKLNILPKLLLCCIYHLTEGAKNVQTYCGITGLHSRGDVLLFN